ncbi:protein brambleberry [Aethina tumida]|uniref:protein brambleberry n=1 Tax=Aethina tumida TaxID=116153 RepID=UPI00096B52D1|nr:protein brambleberry [Aethina tumida]
MKALILFIFALLVHPHIADAFIKNYVKNIGEYFGYKQGENEISESEFHQRIPYEVSTVDEKFISEAAKLTGVALSELDSCQHRVVLKLKTDCHKMNDEDVAKMAVHLLNCQSYVEGRQMFPCSDDMGIKECTTNMDSDTWTTYHLMSNRARAVCYTIRQSQFRGLAENTVNRLMEAAKDQLQTLGKIAYNQENLREMAETTYEKLTEGHDALSKQQSDIRKAQFQGQLAIEDNIRRLADEKRLILETHNEIIQMTKSMEEKLQQASSQMDNQNNESKNNHKQLAEDLLKIQSKTHEVFHRLDEFSHLMVEQNRQFKKQYESTLKNLAEVNRTVHNLVSLVGGTRQALEERLSWLTTALGGTDLAIERLYIILWHFGFMLLAMLSCAFLTAKLSTRIAVVSLPPLNLALAFYGEQHYLDPISLLAAIGVFVLIQSTVTYALNHKKIIKPALSWPKKNKSTTPVNNTPDRDEYSTLNNATFLSTKSFDEDEEVQFTEHRESFRNLTPPLSRNGFYSPRSRSGSRTPSLYSNGLLKSDCQAMTRQGTPCKLSALYGKQYCYRHEKGDSVLR